MQIKKILSVLPFFFMLIVKTHSQDLAIGQWRTHLPYAKALHVTDAGSKVYCASSDGLFSYNKNDNSISIYTKIDGLSDIGYDVIRYSPSYDVLFIGYENSNIDLLYGNQIVNISDLKRANIVGGKTINDVLFVGRYAYLSCSFGIVVVDLERREIKATYLIGPNGGNVNVSGIAFDGTDLYASTNSGVYRANINDPFINIYTEWTNILTPGPGVVFDQIVYFNNKILLKADESGNNDYILSYDYVSWSNAGIGLYEIRRLRVADNKLVVAATYNMKVFDASMQEIRNIDQSTYSCLIFDATLDASGNAWIADNRKGLVRVNPVLQFESILPDGPWSKNSSDMQMVDEQLWVGHSMRGRKWENIYSHDGFSTFVNNKWTTFDGTNLSSPLVSIGDMYDFMGLGIDPNNTNHVFLGSRGKGLLEVENGVVKNYYNQTNSTLQEAYPGSCQTGAIRFDKNNNVWVVNSTVAYPLCVLRPDGTWEKFAFSGLGGVFAGELLIDSYNQKWINFYGNGTLVIFNDESSKVRMIHPDHLPSGDIRSIVEDKDGQVWVGTAAGVGVFYSPSSILDNLSDSTVRAEQILIEQDGHTQYLLATETVTAIAVDGANRKWFGTEAGGVFLMSADGTAQLGHFTTENSPLLSDNITGIAINDRTGEVFFGTDKGIVSYRSDATVGAETCDGYLVFPNPVKHDYTGPIAISGLVNNADVKITDISGALVFHAKANGGEAIWNGNNFKGERAHTGVYLVYASNDDGSATCVTKVLFTH
jgi:hypothetical protein